MHIIIFSILMGKKKVLLGVLLSLWCTVPELSFLSDYKKQFKLPVFNSSAQVTFKKRPEIFVKLKGCWNACSKDTCTLLVIKFRVLSLMFILRDLRIIKFMFTTSSFLKFVLFLNERLSLNDGSSVWEFPLTPGESGLFLFRIPLSKLRAASLSQNT